jgi:tetratricopeptide (TPR) repeat protein
MKKAPQKITTTIFLLLIGLMANAQSIQLKKANDLFDHLAYIEAIEAYKDVLDKDKDNGVALANLAHCYRLTSNTKLAEFYYKRALKYNHKDNSLVLYYGQALMSNAKYDEALTQFKQYAKIVPYDSRGEHFVKACENVNTLRKDSSMYKISNFSGNSKESEFGPAFYKGGIVFASSRIKNRLEAKNDWNGEAYTDLYFSEKIGYKWSTPVELSGKTATKFHEGPAVFNSDFSKMYFTRNVNSSTTKRVGTANLKIFEAVLQDDTWVVKSELPFCSDEYSNGHPAITADGKKMYFTSNRLGGQGGKDIYVSYYKEGRWLEPHNLGPEVNTEGDEMFPTVHNDGTLYFASDGLGGFGGLDVFQAIHKGGDANWTVSNIGYPINTSKDDMGLILSPDRQKGFFASNRNGSDDIFELSVSEIKAKEWEKNLPSVTDKEALVVNNAPKSQGDDDYTIKIRPISDTKIENKTPEPGKVKPYRKPPGTGGEPDEKRLPKIPDELLVVADKQPNTFVLKGIVLSKKYNKELANAEIALIDLTDNSVKKFTTKDDGNFYFYLPAQKLYKAVVYDEDGAIVSQKYLNTYNTKEPIMHATLFGKEKTSKEPPIIISPPPPDNYPTWNPKDRPGTIPKKIPDSDTEPPTIIMSAPVFSDPATAKKVTAALVDVNKASLQDLLNNPSYDVVFKVQLGAYNSALNENNNMYKRKNISYEIERNTNSMLRYMSADSFKDATQAKNLAHEAQRKGIRNAFVAVYVNGQRLEKSLEDFEKNR